MDIKGSGRVSGTRKMEFSCSRRVTTSSEIIFPCSDCDAVQWNSPRVRVGFCLTSNEIIRFGLGCVLKENILSCFGSNCGSKEFFVGFGLFFDLTSNVNFKIW